MSHEMKVVNLTRKAAEDMMGGSYPAKRRGGRTSKKSHGGATDVSSTPVPAAADTKVIHFNPIGGNTALPPVPQGLPLTTSHNPLTRSPLPIVPVVPNVSSPSTPPQPPQPQPQPQPTRSEGGSVKVELKKKPATKKVHLQPKKAPDAPKAALHVKKTAKRARKIVLGVSSMHRRLTRAKKTQSQVSTMSLDKLKELLVAKKLIKATSTAPEAVLRQIAADAQIVADKAL